MQRRSKSAPNGFGGTLRNNARYLARNWTIGITG
jgi:hypothetical protein